jgi:hypothetical protein
MSTDESLQRAEELLARLEQTRERLEKLAGDEEAEQAIEILGELSDLSKQVEEELQRAKREAEADAQS